MGYLFGPLKQLEDKIKTTIGLHHETCLVHSCGRRMQCEPKLIPVEVFASGLLRSSATLTLRNDTEVSDRAVSREAEHVSFLATQRRDLRSGERGKLTARHRMSAVKKSANFVEKCARTLK